MESLGIEKLAERFESWGNLAIATKILETKQKEIDYDCNWCSSGCGGCAGCGGSSLYLPEIRNVEAKASYQCQGCSACNGCNSCE